MSRAAKRRAIADKVAENIARLAKEIADRRKHLLQVKARMLTAGCREDIIQGDPIRIIDEASWFRGWSKHIEPIARAVGALERAKAKLPKAKEKADRASMLDRAARDKRARIDSANVGLMRRLDALAADARVIDQRWAKERAQEAKREQALKKKIAKRTTRDYTARPDWMRRPVKLPDPVQQPQASLPESDVPPPRDGLIPGTYSVMDPQRLQRLIDKPALPTVWTATYVGVRLIEAHKVLLRTPGTIWPKGFGAAWPAYKMEAGEAAIQAGAGTLSIGRNGFKVAPSSEAVARMNQAICWPMQFLRSRPGAAADVNWWAADAAWDQMDFDSRGAPWIELQIIADALNAAKEVVT